MTGRSGAGLSFDGTDDYVTKGNVLILQALCLLVRGLRRRGLSYRRQRKCSSRSVYSVFVSIEAVTGKVAFQVNTAMGN